MQCDRKYGLRWHLMQLCLCTTSRYCREVLVSQYTALASNILVMMTNALLVALVHWKKLDTVDRNI